MTSFIARARPGGEPGPWLPNGSVRVVRQRGGGLDQRLARRSRTPTPGVRSS
ncbi:hypothetical protein [Actinomadura fibrosa]|uniref:Uncharacterized protein n=1 Tax=Actinomadura fibrosa TaxID=111802 RepID=A0ABW2XY37_9ACTN|nr:hypothetical protein [Actinomadura fibrosa]